MLKKLMTTKEVEVDRGYAWYRLTRAARVGKIHAYRSGNKVAATLAFEKRDIDMLLEHGKADVVDKPRLYTPMQVSRRVGFSHVWIIKLLERGEIDGYVAGNKEYGRIVYFLGRKGIQQLLERKVGCE